MTAGTVELVVEIVIEPYGVVVCRRTAGAQVRALRSGGRLAGRVVKHVQTPQKKQADGTVDTDVFAFAMRERADAAQFSVGQRVKYVNA